LSISPLWRQHTESGKLSSVKVLSACLNLSFSNYNLIDKIENAGLKISGRSIDGSLVEMVEISDHPWFVACQFHPEFTSSQ
jgi:gamma-glutamyl-gamma-aminobutyrate hydrolase PuuD